MAKKIKRRERDTIIQALRAGVVPKVGLQYIQVGRFNEIKELVKDIERIGEGGSAIRFIIGDYGSGKTFFLNLVRLIAIEKGLVVMGADLAPDRRLHASAGQARGLYAEMARNLSTRTKPEGGALSSIVERFVTKANQEAEEKGLQTGQVIRTRLEHFEEMTGGFEFAEVVRKYWEAYETDDDDLKSACMRWLRGEFATKTDARKALGVRTIVDDKNVYDHLKLMSAFVCAAGYNGLMVSLDEMVNLYKLTSSQARNSNYEQILRILNDVLQGTASHIGFLMGGTPDFLLNTRRGLYSYEALQTRLAENQFAKNGLIDLSGPVITLANLTPEDMRMLLENIRAVMQEPETMIPDEALDSFMHHCSNRIGEAYFKTPRNTVTAFVNLMSILEQNPGTNWADLIEAIEVAPDGGDDLSDIVDEDEDTGGKGGGAALDPEDEDDLASFKL
ncbi:ATP-binding protein [Cohaesibacter celericrescens]|uniref:ATP-binding protein n=1 Tax=Cohaesibacter celericrescens TaxID=2067669 RepID=A0A2N5XPY9_9HYPH|nr:ATP-binding protein [Cohaesibacter celericrescens]PLW76554.1 ATP-binding protein [Cohaesibacter celericrescens]